MRVPRSKRCSARRPRDELRMQAPRRLLNLFTIVLVMSCACVHAQFIVESEKPQKWPERPFRVVVPFTPGSATDAVARIVTDRLGPHIGQTFVVENRPGAGGTIGMALVAKANPDGYTILVHS